MEKCCSGKAGSAKDRPGTLGVKTSSSVSRSIAGSRRASRFAPHAHPSCTGLLALVACVAPIFSAGMATAASAAALLLLTYSFAVDTWWLFRVPLRAPVRATP